VGELQHDKKRHREKTGHAANRAGLGKNSKRVKTPRPAKDAKLEGQKNQTKQDNERTTKTGRSWATPEKRAKNLRKPGEEEKGLKTQTPLEGTTDRGGAPAPYVLPELKRKKKQRPCPGVKKKRTRHKFKTRKG